jgi:hypothetical protein
MGTVRADNFSDGAGTGAPDFADGLKVSGGFDTTGGAGVATISAEGVNFKNKYAVLEASSDITGTGIVTDWNIDNLEIGETYAVTLSLFADYLTSTAGTVVLEDASGADLFVMHQFLNGTGSTVRIRTSNTYYHTPSNANEQSLRFHVTQLTGSASIEAGTTNADRSQVIIRETNDLVVGTF